MMLAEALLRDFPGLQIIATSRWLLAVPGEHTYQVQPLPVGTTADPTGGVCRCLAGFAHCRYSPRVRRERLARRSSARRGMKRQIQTTQTHAGMSTSLVREYLTRMKPTTKRAAAVP
ncbi:hypothetical protein ACFVH6_09090 [Spirillospora sp. NPDC127200]